MVVRGPGVPQVLSIVWVVLSGLVWLLGSQKMWLFHWGNAGESLVRQRMMKARQQSHSEQKHSGFCSAQRRYTLVKRAEVHSIYPRPEWGNWHSRGGLLYSRWEKKWLCFFKEEFGKSWQNFKPLFSSTCKFITGNLPFTLICCCCCSVAHVSDSLVTPWTAACQAPLSFTVSQSLRKFRSIASVMLSNHLILCLPLLLPPSSFASIRVFSNELALHIGWPKYWSFSFSNSPSNEYSQLISFGMDWLDLLAVQGSSPTHSSKASILQCSPFFLVQLSHLYMTTGKISVLTTWTFVSKVMSLLLNMLSRFVIAFLSRNRV